MLAFTAPFLHAPFLLIVLSLGLGLFGLAGGWRGIRPGIQLIALLSTAAACFLFPLIAYGSRHGIRTEQMLNQVRTGWRTLITDPKLLAFILPVFYSLLIFLFVFFIASSDLMWEMVRWLLFEPGYGELAEPSPYARILAGMPLFLMAAYVGFMISLTYISSLLPALHYASEMNRELPQPIFLNGHLLTQVVRSQAEAHLARPGGFITRMSRSRERWVGEGIRDIPENLDKSGGAIQPVARPVEGGVLSGPSVATQTSQPPVVAMPLGLHSVRRWRDEVERVGRWNWEGMERMPDGGIIMKARGEEQVKDVETDAGFSQRRRISVIYTVTADPWGRIREIRREVEKGSL